MGHDYGRFVWFELKTSDKEAALRFYPEVLGWKSDGMKMGDGSTYNMFLAGEAAFGGLADLPMPGVPPHWVSYVSVEDVDKTAKSVIEHGGKALMDAIDIPSVGRIQGVSDPEGGVLFLFHAEEGDRPPATGAGSYHWNELWAKDPKALLGFYEKVFGYQHEKMDMPEGEYFILKNGEQSRGGIMTSPIEAPTHWTQYVHVDDVDATLKRAEANGGKAAGPAMDVPGVGRFAVIQDQAGAAIGVITPAS